MTIAGQTTRIMGDDRAESASGTECPPPPCTASAESTTWSFGRMASTLRHAPQSWRTKPAIDVRQTQEKARVPHRIRVDRSVFVLKSQLVRTKLAARRSTATRPFYQWVRAKPPRRETAVKPRGSLARPQTQVCTRRIASNDPPIVLKTSDLSGCAQLKRISMICLPILGKEAAQKSHRSVSHSQPLQTVQSA